MLIFYPRMIRTFEDLPGHISLLIHSWNGCNMRCFGCHNHEELIALKPVGFLTADAVLERLRGCGTLFDAVLLSGGEFLINEMAGMEQFLHELRSVFRGKIIVFTNGAYPQKLRRLLHARLIDGVHMDMKLPFHCLDPEADREVIEAIIGVAPSRRLCRDIVDCLDVVIRHNSPFSQVRTVRYPQLSEQYFEEIKCYVQQLNHKYNSSVPYFVNPYCQPEQVLSHY
ncbi:4Fe-4S cluster-binding domain-containing protein [Paenibacillus oenotherae]|uniref:4Fe-4S cluster-binding domain-containing protein n=1 Tax=Paenibacillus oenotherae TaxID=1435645 RepID=A0ABS7D6T5_9BACL|nr:radical SAM protein [Paenibacillus oenotherae]MBW7475236.1 4Fe-4S cluster-binding domain-containing protein [Paenibacillus oenotherae]